MNRVDKVGVRSEIDKIFALSRPHGQLFALVEANRRMLGAIVHCQIRRRVREARQLVEWFLQFFQTISAFDSSQSFRKKNFLFYFLFIFIFNHEMRYYRVGKGISNMFGMCLMCRSRSFVTNGTHPLKQHKNSILSKLSHKFFF